MDTAIISQRMRILAKETQQKGIFGVRTQDDFARLLDMHRVNFAKALSGQRAFTVSQLYRTGALFGVSMDWLFGFSDTQSLASQRINAPPTANKSANKTHPFLG